MASYTISNISEFKMHVCHSVYHACTWS